VAVVYARTWKNSNLEALRHLAGRKGARVRLLLPDRDRPEVVEELARRFGKSAADVSAAIKETVDDFAAMFRDPDGAKLEVWPHHATPVYAAYRFDHRIVVTTYKHRPEKQSVPVLVVEKEGTLFQFFKEELDALASVSSGVARHVA
jgi:cytochrome oxidase Cu insertion factor (SCO1/SenC/PrrC family)